MRKRLTAALLFALCSMGLNGENLLLEEQEYGSIRLTSVLNVDRIKVYLLKDELPVNAEWIGISIDDDGEIIDLKRMTIKEFLQKYKKGYDIPHDVVGKKVRVSLWAGYNKKTKTMVERLHDTGWVMLTIWNKILPVETQASGHSSQEAAPKKSSSSRETPETVERPKAPDGYVFVEGGSFIMGSPPDKTYKVDDKQHRVTVGSFYMKATEVTQREWRMVMGNNPSLIKGDGRPVENVSWFDAVEYCNALSRKYGLNPVYRISGESVAANWNANGYRLPTEAEWEYAARGGGRSLGFARYAGSNDLDEVGWHDGNSGNRTHPVGQKAANELGLYDMSGNVWEWCWDWYREDYYSHGPASNPMGPETGSNRVSRGGGFMTSGIPSWLAFRHNHPPSHQSVYQGLRPVLSDGVRLYIEENVLSADELDRLTKGTLKKKSYGTVRYPSIVSTDSGIALNVLNNELEEQALAFLKEGVVSYSCDYTIGLATPRLVSLKMEQYYYYQGAASGHESLSIVNFGLSLDKAIEFHDLFDAKKGALQGIKRLIIENLPQDCRSEPFDEYYESNYIPRFFLYNTGIEFVFSEYEILPGYCGNVAVDFPYDELAKWIKPSGLLGAYIAENTVEQPGEVPEGYVLVEGGTFRMGSTDGDSDEKPVHSVTVDSFYMKATEVTHQEFLAFLNSAGVSRTGQLNGNEIIDMDDEDVAIDYSGGRFNFTGSSYAASLNTPVIEQTWYGAVEYCNWLSKKEGRTPVYRINGNSVTANWSTDGYRLPTEAEWEYAARGGKKSRGYKYSGSNSAGSVGWYNNNSEGQTHPVGQKQANELGLYDMSGNVWEWCWDWYGDYSSGSQRDPRGPSSGSGRVRRGGSWYGDGGRLRSAYRSYNSPGNSDNNLGFRLAFRT